VTDKEPMVSSVGMFSMQL